MNGPAVWCGESLRWYLRHARHPGKGFIVGHYWRWFCRPRFWIRYDNGVISVSLADYLQQRIFFDDYYERPLIAWLRDTLRPTDTFWDIGANVGAVTLVAARHCRRVVAFEPDPRSIPLLERHVRASGLTNVEVVRAALGDQAGRAVLHQAPTSNTGMTSLVPRIAGGSGATALATVLRADDLLADRPDLAPDVLKIDVEGAEALVLRGAAGLLARGRVRVIVFEDDVTPSGAPASQEAVEILAGAGFRIAAFGRSDERLDDGKSNFLASRT